MLSIPQFLAHFGQFLYYLLIHPTVLLDTKKNKEKEKTKNWMIKTIEKSMNRMKSVLHFMKHKFKYYFNWIECEGLKI